VGIKVITLGLVIPSEVEGSAIVCATNGQAKPVQQCSTSLHRKGASKYDFAMGERLYSTYIVASRSRTEGWDCWREIRKTADPSTALGMTIHEA
jgi:hypothetical protein